VTRAATIVGVAVAATLALLSGCSSTAGSRASTTGPTSSAPTMSASERGTPTNTVPASSTRTGDTAPASAPASSASTAKGQPPSVVSVAIASAATVSAPGGDGDLWPNCWGTDDAIHAAHGDGKGFGEDGSDIGVDTITGTPGHLKGVTLATGNEVGQIWTLDGQHTRKPTGMACVGSTLYLAVQDLATNFDDAPAASISRSEDGGRTWTWDRSAPMFSDGIFTTIMFLDYGKGYANAPDGYVYAYGLDHNWRDSYSNTVDDPQDVYLARVPRNSVQDRASWQFFSGTGADGAPTWTADIARRKAVLHDGRRLFHDASGPLRDISVISQGGVVYDAPLRRYFYTSWTEYSFEFYTAVTPWGPWKLMASKDFGEYPWTSTSYGGYATTIPSKFISADGTRMWVQSNVCPCANAGVTVYDFSLRTMSVTVTSEAAGERG
jgi:hypothetical protein